MTKKVKRVVTKKKITSDKAQEEQPVTPQDAPPEEPVVVDDGGEKAEEKAEAEEKVETQVEEASGELRDLILFCLSEQKKVRLVDIRQAVGEDADIKEVRGMLDELIEEGLVRSTYTKGRTFYVLTNNDGAEDN